VFARSDGIAARGLVVTAGGTDRFSASAKGVLGGCGVGAASRTTGFSIGGSTGFSIAG
jgi:hypothetical protein